MFRMFKTHAIMADIAYFYAFAPKNGGKDRWYLIDEAEIWCNERFGQAGASHDGTHWRLFGGDFFFTDENQAFEFRMRWC